jgi:tetratricopeptide (TPR) repeat protein
VVLLVPGLVLAENFDDHDRSGRYIARDFAWNYLNSCAPNAILFTNGDNDTFPLWYAQEVEGIRTDVRVICLPYLATDWYIDQMKKRVRDSEPVPFSLDRKAYAPGKRDYIYVYERMKDTVELRDLVGFIASDNPETKLPLQDGSYLDYLPARNLKLTVDRQKVLSTGTVSPEDADKIVDRMIWKISRGALYKNDLMILDLIASNQWERPVYFTSINHENILGPQQYFRLEGFAYRLVPIRNEDPSGYTATINTSLLYDRFMNTFRWGNIDSPQVFIDANTYRTTLILRLRNKFASLAEKLLEEGKRDSAIAVADKAVGVLPAFNFANDLGTLQLAEVYYKAGSPEKANALVREYAGQASQELAYYLSVDQKFGGALNDEAEQTLSILGEMIRIADAYGQKALSEELKGIADKLIQPN